MHLIKKKSSRNSKLALKFYSAKRFLNIDQSSQNVGFGLILQERLSLP